MLTSMTGFGRAEGNLSSSARTVVEIQTLNHRFLEVDCRLPEGFLSFEQAIRALVGRTIRRGRVRVFVGIKSKHQTPAAAFQVDVARQYAASLRQLKKQLHLSGEVTLETVLSLPRVVGAPSSAEFPERSRKMVEQTVGQAIAQLTAMRQKEGGRLEKVFRKLVVSLENLNRRIVRRVPEAQKNLTQRLQARIQAAAAAADPVAVAKEAAALVRETDVSEELTRIQSHLVALRRAIGGQAESQGRTMDFLAQELQREVNTLGVKIRDAAVIRWVVEMKGLIEKLREQAANVE